MTQFSLRGGSRPSVEGNRVLYFDWLRFPSCFRDFLGDPDSKNVSSFLSILEDADYEIRLALAADSEMEEGENRSGEIGEGDPFPIGQFDEQL